MKELLFPRVCIGCGFLGCYICPSCQKQLRQTKDTCVYCGKMSAHGLTHPNCKQNYGIDGLISLYLYDNLLKKIIKNIKYRLATVVFDEFFSFSGEVIINKSLFYLKKYDNLVIQPIPLSYQKEKIRGFNQSEIIVNKLVQLFSINKAQLLQRLKNTAAQAQLNNALERRLNVKNSFYCVNTNKENVLLVDDVVTSAATVKEAARVLKKAGVTKVIVFCLARGW